MLDREKILVVEQVEEDAQKICRGLAEKGYEVLGPTADFEQAVSIAREQEPGLILINLHLGSERGGIEVVREIQVRQDIPVIYISVPIDKKTCDEAKESRPYGYITKPFEIQELYSSIEVALFKHKNERETVRAKNILSATLQSIGEAVVTTDSDLMVTYANPMAASLFGVPEGGLNGRNIESLCSFFQGRELDELQLSVQEISHSGSRRFLPDEVYVKNIKGEMIPVSGSFSPIADENREPAGVVLVLQDKTRQHREEGAARLRDRLEKAGNEIRSLLIRDELPDFISILGILARALNADRAYIGLYSPGKSLKQSQLDTIEWVRSDSKEVFPPLNAASNTFGSWWHQGLYDGKILFFGDVGKMPEAAQPEKGYFKRQGVKSLAVIPFRSEETRCYGFIGVDWIAGQYRISEPETSMLEMMSEFITSNMVRVRAEEKLRDSESRFRTLIQRSSDITTVLDENRRFVFLSPSVQKIMGYEPGELLGKDVFDFVHEEDKAHLLGVFNKLLKNPSDDLVVESRFRHKKGHWIFLESMGSNLVENPAIHGIVVNSRDVTDRKRVESELIRARDAAEEMNRVKTAMLANMSHEMRTPLTGVLGFASILESDLPAGDAREMATRIHTSGRRLLETIESILDLAKLESEKLDIQLEEVNIIDEVRRAMEAHNRFARQKGLDFEFRSDFDELYIEIDRQLFSRVMYNLFSNAFKYTDEGEISVQVSQFKKRNQKWVQIDVQDTGIGISQEFLPRVFDEFQQESTGLSRKFEGSGLGLTITRRLVEIMGGVIMANSKKGEGSIFTVQLPLKEDVQYAPSTPASEAVDRLREPSDKPQVLVVEDDFDSSVIVKFYLGKEYQVKTVESGEKALEVMSSNHFHLIILDISLGAGMDGVATLKAIRANPHWADIPVVALTAHALGGDAEYYLKQGFTEYLAKPFKKLELLKVVQKHI
ncbi:response regulator [Balneolales bacterium ANBcel1]|nr:response regulator [Balneolales bacterium ANBcel1]